MRRSDAFWRQKEILKYHGQILPELYTLVVRARLLMNFETAADRELIGICISGDCTDAFNELYRRYSGVVYSVCMRMLRNHADAQDATTACFLLFLKKPSRLAGRESADGWFYWCARCTSMNAIRMRNTRSLREKEASEMKPAYEIQSSSDDLLSAIEAEIAVLPAHQRETVLLRFYRGMMPQEIADMLKRPLNTVNGQLQRALGTIRERLSKKVGVLSDSDLLKSLSSSALIFPVPLGIHEQVACFLKQKASSMSVTELVRRTERVIFVTRLKAVAGVAACLAAVLVPVGVAASLSGAGGAKPAVVAPGEPPVMEHVAFCVGREYLDGPAPEASCADHKIWGVDRKGNQYVTGIPTMAIRVITTNGLVKTIAGDDRCVGSIGVEEGPASMLTSDLGGAESGHRGSGVYLGVWGLPLEGEDSGCIYTSMSGYPCRIFKNKQKGGRWWFKMTGRGSVPLPVKAGDSVAFKDADLKGVALGEAPFKINGCLYSWDGENGRITCLLSPADYAEKCLHWKTGKGLGKAEQISISEDGTMYVLYYNASYPNGQVFRITKDRSKVEEITRSSRGFKHVDGMAMNAGYACGPYGVSAYKDIVLLYSVDGNGIRRWKDGRISSLCENDGEWRELTDARGGGKFCTAKGISGVPPTGYVYLYYPGEERGGGTGCYRYGPVDFLKPTVGPLAGGN